MEKAHWTEKYPHLLQEWHPSENVGINPMSSKLKDRVWWYLPYDDPETGKHFDFEWQAQIDSRVYGLGCPYLSGRAVWPGYNDLSTKRADLAAQWHPTKNGEWTPEMVTCCSSKRVWWYLPYDDPETGKHFDFEWRAKIPDRVKGHGCPYLSGQAVWPGFNDLETCSKLISEEWHHGKNRKKKPNQIYMCEYVTKRWWICSKCGHEWRATVYARTIRGVICPNCRRNRDNFE